MFQVANPQRNTNNDHLIVIDLTVDIGQKFRVIIDDFQHIIEHTITVVTLNFQIRIVVRSVTLGIFPLNINQAFAICFRALNVRAINTVNRNAAPLRDVANNLITRNWGTAMT